MKAAERTSLALSHARLHAASDMLRWAMTGLNAKVLDPKDVLAVVEMVDKWKNEVWKELCKRE